MADVYWRFGKKTYQDYSKFCEAVASYNDRINKAINRSESGWEPSREVADGPIQVTYEAGWMDDQEDATLTVDLGEPGARLSMGQILFALQNAIFSRTRIIVSSRGSGPMEGGRYHLITGS